MNLESCFLCHLPVLELEGQFEKLDTYLLDQHEDAYQQRAFGWCHASCLSNSKWGPFWAKRRIEHLTETLGLPVGGSNAALTAINDLRSKDVTIIRADGVSFTLAPSILDSERDYPEGLLVPVSEEMNLEFDDLDLTRRIRDTLVHSQRFPLSFLLKALGITDYMLYPHAVSKGALLFDRNLSRQWVGTWVSAIATYNHFIPYDVVKLVKSIQADH